VSVRSAARAVVVSALALATVPALVPGVAHATTTAVDCNTQDLQPAINAAAPGDTLHVTGICFDPPWTIGKNLTLEGPALLDAISVNDSALTISGSPTVTLNGIEVVVCCSALPPDFGGGIRNDAGTLTLVSSSVEEATANVGGGIYNGGTLTLNRSSVWSNTSTGQGGGIYNGGTMTMENSTVTGNGASGQGGGIYNSGTLTVTASTVAGNGASAGGGIFGPASVTATIVAGNSATTAPDCQAVTSGGYNLAGNTSGCSGLGATDMQNVDPMLDILNFNGPGGLRTRGLLAGSPAIGAIPLSGGACLVGGQLTDERGVSRPQGKGCDIGAVEKSRTTTSLGSSDDPSTLGQPVTFTATVCMTGPPPVDNPRGTVKFRDGGSGPVLDAGVDLNFTGTAGCAEAELSTSALGSGRHKIVAIYSGDSVNFKSRGSVIQRVKA
jgi:predicted outer membrane repeat protein